VDPSFFQPLLHWVAAHPTWAGAAVFVIAFSESLAFIGLIVPGAVLLFGVGALIATGSMPLWPTLIWIAAGAIAGDGLSFWFGYHYREHLCNMWLFSRYPELFRRSIGFVEQHGGKSVLLGRFVGALRPLVPAVAGMLHMSPTRYVVINILSAFVWAPAYILPGVVFGASLGLAAEVGARLVVLFLLVFGLLVLMFWVVRHVFRLFEPHANSMAARVLAWSDKHPWLGELSASLVDPRHPESGGLLIFAVVLVLAGLGFFSMLWGVQGSSSPSAFDTAVFNLLQGLRTPWADRVMITVTELGNALVSWAVTMAALLWLVWREHFSAAAHLFASVAFASLFNHVLKLALQVARPIDIGSGISAYAFPSGHATISMALYGFLAVLISQDLPGPHRSLPYVVAGLIIVPISFSRLYLGAHWFSDVLGGMALGLTWVALVGIAYRRHVVARLPWQSLSAVVLGALVVFGGRIGLSHYDEDETRYAVRHSTRDIPAEAWWENAWQELPAYRIDLGGHWVQPLTLQLAGRLDEFQEHLEAQGWKKPAPLTLPNSLLWLNPTLTLEGLPVLPQVNDGRHESLLLEQAHHNPDTRLVLRMWPADTRLAETGAALWVGYVAPQKLVRPMDLFAFPRTGTHFDEALSVLKASLSGLTWRAVRRTLDTHESQDSGWKGEVLLIRVPPAQTGLIPARLRYA
jgi:Uncharacterized membrane-associated protein